MVDDEEGGLIASLNKSALLGDKLRSEPSAERVEVMGPPLLVSMSGEGPLPDTRCRLKRGIPEDAVRLLFLLRDLFNGLAGGTGEDVLLASSSTGVPLECTTPSPGMVGDDSLPNT